MNADDPRFRYTNSWPGEGPITARFLITGGLRFLLWTTALGGVGVYLYLNGFFVNDVYALKWAWTARRTSIQLLSAARTTNELQQAVHSLGAFITPTNGGWLAIRYRDKHGGRLQSIAIAHDSEGRWFESRHHWCGTIGRVAKDVSYGMSVVAAEKALEAELRNPGATYREPRVNHLKLLHVFAASNLDEARRSLLAAGFQEFTP